MLVVNSIDELKEKMKHEMSEEFVQKPEKDCVSEKPIPHKVDNFRYANKF